MDAAKMRRAWSGPLRSGSNSQNNEKAQGCLREPPRTLAADHPRGVGTVRRPRLPELDAPQTLEDALKSSPRPALMAWEGERRSSLKSTLERWRSLEADTSAMSLFIGPEGGFDPAEVESALEHGVETIGLGNRILRSETAAMTLTATVMHELGELEP